MSALLVYGANGYTGELIARRAFSQGLKPILAGRSRDAIEALAKELGCEARVAALDDPAALDRALAGVSVVLHCAGPFIHTSRPMADACLRAGAHYLDITGEIAVFEALAARSAEAAAKGVVLMPGVGFDVVPTDSLAAHLKRRLPSAARLLLAVRALSSTSQGTMKSALGMFPNGGVVRRDGKLVTVPLGAKTLAIDFGHGPKHVVQAPWGDVATAFHTTGIPSIETYLSFSRAASRALPVVRALSPLLARRTVQRLLGKLIERLPAGPDEAAQRAGKSFVYGEVEDPQGQRRVSRLSCPEGYAFTAVTALAAAQEVLTGKVSPGFRTPAGAFGPDWVLQFEGVSREDVS